MIEILNTTAKPPQKVSGVTGLIAGIELRILIIKKYIFANLLNCRRSDSKYKACVLGIKLYHRYFDVITKLL